MRRLETFNYCTLLDYWYYSKIRSFKYLRIIPMTEGIFFKAQTVLGDEGNHVMLAFPHISHTVKYKTYMLLGPTVALLFRDWKYCV